MKPRQLVRAAAALAIGILAVACSGSASSSTTTSEPSSLTVSGRPMEFVRSFYRGDRYQLVTELTPSRSRNGRVTLVDARSLVNRSDSTTREEESS